MRHDVARDLSWSAKTFQGVVWPEIRHLCMAGELQPVEAVMSLGFEKQLDMLAGIDAWQVGKDFIRPIATRVQKIGPFRSFTVRKRRPNGSTTEWQKRIEAIKRPELGMLRPALTIQAYVRGSDLLYACIARSDDLYRMATPEHRDTIWTDRQNRSDRVDFAAFWVARLKRAGVKVWEWPARSIKEALSNPPAVCQLFAQRDRRQ